jgi:hypothetical protein
VMLPHHSNTNGGARPGVSSLAHLDVGVRDDEREGGCERREERSARTARVPDVEHVVRDRRVE